MYNHSVYWYRFSVRHEGTLGNILEGEMLERDSETVEKRENSSSHSLVN